MNRPAPLTPPDCDLTGYGWFPLHHRRLKQSEWWLSASDLARSRNVDLWCEAYEQIPAASLPDSDVVLARLAGFGRDVEGFRATKAEIMGAWVLCSDGRWYHPTLATVALEAWAERRLALWQRECDRIRKENKRREKDGLDPLELPARPPEIAAVPPEIQEASAGQAAEKLGNPPENALKGQDTTGQEDSSVPSGTGAPAPLTEDEQFAEIGRVADPGKRGWDGLMFVLTARGEAKPGSARTLIGKWKRDHSLTGEEMWAMAEGAWKAETRDPQPYLAKAAAEIAQRRGQSQTAGRTPTDEVPDYMARVWMQDFVEAPHQWKRHERGPKPGEDGCRVGPEIQREFGVEPAAPSSGSLFPDQPRSAA